MKINKILYYVILVVVFLLVESILIGAWVMLISNKEPGIGTIGGFIILSYLAASYLAPKIRKKLGIKKQEDEESSF